MRCKTCDYSLWNLRDRRCPECGTAFCVADYEFRPSSVQYCCPHCGQDYYGMSGTGHLVPSEFACVQCQNTINQESMILLPTAGLQEAQTQIHHLPWHERKSIGFLKAWSRMVGWGFARPVEVGRHLRPEPTVGEAIWFAAVTVIGAIGLCYALPLLMCGIFGGMAGGGMSPLAMVALGGMFVVGGVLLAINLCALAAHLIVWSSGSHASGLGATMDAMNFTTGPFVLAAVPCLGGYLFPVGWIWWGISSSLALSERQRISRLRSFVAVGLPAFVIPLLLLGLFTATIVGNARMVTPGPPLTTPTPLADTSTVLIAVKLFAQRHPGKPLRHPIELIADQKLSAGLFVEDIINDGSEVPVGDSTLLEFCTMIQMDERTAEAIDGYIEAELDSVDPDASAVRLGRMVFPMYDRSILPPGYETEAIDPAVWIVINSPMQGAIWNPELIEVGLADGTVRRFTTDGDFYRGLTEQNALRTELGLPALDHPDNVKHAGQ